MRSYLAGALLPFAAFWAAGANAQSVVRITNADNAEIPLATGSSVNFDSNGNVEIQCALEGGKCAALSAGQITPPLLNFTRTGTGNPMAGQSLSFNWSTTNAVACYATQTGPASTSWPGVRQVTGSAVSVPVNSPGNYVFSLQCFTDGGGQISDSIAVTVEESQVVTNCNLPSHPAIQPSGFTRIDQTWEQAFKAPNSATSFTYPNAASILVPILVEKGQYKAISFTPAANETVQLQWFQAQANFNIGYTTARPAAGVMVSISPCPGDFRNIGDGTDPAASFRCRWFADQLNQQFYTTDTSIAGACQVTPGVVHYINVIAADPNGGITPGEDSCGQPGFTGCDITVKSSRL